MYISVWDQIVGILFVQNNVVLALLLETGTVAGSPAYFLF
jgi:hypothetical protein